jgi:acetylornithine deacetylase/succinyl-diaminopimelate desuccinylase-like protein
MHHSIRLLRELIALPSVNPAFLAPGDPCGGELRIAKFLQATAAKAGLDVQLDRVAPGRFNVLIRLAPVPRTRQRILLAPHLDTVGGESPRLFKPRLKNGRLFGRGACDTKGSVAAFLTAVLALARSGRRPQETEIIFAGLIDEENGQMGSRHLARRGPRAELAIVGEPTRLALVTAHKGGLWYELETIGQAAHGARPELGRNAVHAMARAVDLLETEYARLLRGRQHPLLGTATVNVGSIRGGVQPNIVPDRCVAQVDRRSLPGEFPDRVADEIVKLLKRRGIAVSIRALRAEPCPAMETDHHLPLVGELMNIVGQRKPRGVDYFCDAAVLATGGTPSVVFGPGDIAQAHTADEWIETRQVERAAALVERFLRDLP